MHTDRIYGIHERRQIHACTTDSAPGWNETVPTLQGTGRLYRETVNMKKCQYYINTYFSLNTFIGKMALGLCISFIYISTCRNIEQTPCVNLRVSDISFIFTNEHMHTDRIYGIHERRQIHACTTDSAPGWNETVPTLQGTGQLYRETVNMKKCQYYIFR
jgi:hypothetical protein